ncbi:MAG: sigma-54 dependent transcriptional regulator [Candidatus Brocadiaceae bacterium]|nr:sigma-54 dependent transcriptional regulator [Candidatus Brocadiaceae bacterium]
METFLINKTYHFGNLSSKTGNTVSERSKVLAYNNFIGKSPSMRYIFDTIDRVSKNTSTVLITGESGTGKELIANAIHIQSPRRTRPFIVVSCPNLSETLFESELFGHEKGAFTNATDRKIGLAELAQGGTIFFDEISEMSPSNQAKLLRVLQENEFLRVGGTKTISIDVRLIASTNVDLKLATEKGIFREDLFYRLSVVPMYTPPLRERKEDIALVVEHYFQRYKNSFRSKAKEIHPRAMKLLENYCWPGNVRELKNVIERMLTLHGDNETIVEEHLPTEIRRGIKRNACAYTSNPSKLFESLEMESLDEIVSRIERELIRQALKKSNGIQVKAAEILKTTRRILKYKMDKLGMTSDENLCT